MADDKDEIEVDIETTTDKPGEQKPDVEVVEEASAATGTENTLAELRRQLDAEKSARLAAEAQVRANHSNLTKAAEDKRASEMQLVNGAIDTVTREIELLKSNYAAALANNDHSQAAELQFVMSENAAKLQQLRLGKEAMENAPLPNIEQVAPPVDPVEALASQLSVRSANWLRAHPECARDQRLYQKMIAAHNLAVADGVTADTDEYFQFVEQTIGIKPKQAAAAQPSALSQAAAPARSAPPAAPVSRGNGSDGRIVRLSKDEIEMASLMGMSKEEYAKNKQQLKKEGKLN